MIFPGHIVYLLESTTPLLMLENNSLIVEARKINESIILMGSPCHMAP